jgi:hypothetical protein
MTDPDHAVRRAGGCHAGGFSLDLGGGMIHTGASFRTGSPPVLFVSRM